MMYYIHSESDKEIQYGPYRFYWMAWIASKFRKGDDLFIALLIGKCK